VELLEGPPESGGCAGTFGGGPTALMWGATQVAGTGPGGIHSRSCSGKSGSAGAGRHSLVRCVLDLAIASRRSGSGADPGRWQQGRPAKTFPGSDAVAGTLRLLHHGQLGSVAGRDPGAAAPQPSWEPGPADRVAAAGIWPAACWWERAWPESAWADEALARHNPDKGLRNASLICSCGVLLPQEPAACTAASTGGPVLPWPSREPQGLWAPRGLDAA